MPIEKQEGFRLRIGLWLLEKARKYYAWKGMKLLKIMVLCELTCTVEVWSKIKGEATVFTDSDLYDDIRGAVAYYLYESTIKRKGPAGIFETAILPSDYVKYCSREKLIQDAKQHWRFVKKHKIQNIIRKYQTVRYQLALNAGSEISQLDENALAFWKESNRGAKLPDGVGSGNRSITRFLRKRLSEFRKAIGEKNRYRFPFPATAIPGAIAVAIAVMITSSYIKTKAVFTYLGVPYSDYFSLSDYLANSILFADLYIVFIVLSGIWGAWAYSQGTASVWIIDAGVEELERRRDRLRDWAFHVPAIISVVSIAISYWRSEMILPLAPFFITLSVGGLIADSKTIRNLFKDATAAAMAFAFVSLAASHLVYAIFSELNQIIYDTEIKSARAFVFEADVIDESRWRPIAFTTDFILFRNRGNGEIVVRSKYKLKRIIDESTHLAQ